MSSRYGAASVTFHAIKQFWGMRSGASGGRSNAVWQVAKNRLFAYPLRIERVFKIRLYLLCGIYVTLHLVVQALHQGGLKLCAR